MDCSKVDTRRIYISVRRRYVAACLALLFLSVVVVEADYIFSVSGTIAQVDINNNAVMITSSKPVTPGKGNADIRTIMSGDRDLPLIVSARTVITLNGKGATIRQLAPGQTVMAYFILAPKNRFVGLANRIDAQKSAPSASPSTKK